MKIFKLVIIIHGGENTYIFELFFKSKTEREALKKQWKYIEDIIFDAPNLAQERIKKLRSIFFKEKEILEEEAERFLDDSRIYSFFSIEASEEVSEEDVFYF